MPKKLSSNKISAFYYRLICLLLAFPIVFFIAQYWIQKGQGAARLFDHDGPFTEERELMVELARKLKEGNGVIQIFDLQRLVDIANRVRQDGELTTTVLSFCDSFTEVDCIGSRALPCHRSKQEFDNICFPPISPYLSPEYWLTIILPSIGLPLVGLFICSMSLLIWNRIIFFEKIANVFRRRLMRSLLGEIFLDINMVENHIFSVDLSADNLKTVSMSLNGTEQKVKISSTLLKIVMQAHPLLNQKDLLQVTYNEDNIASIEIQDSIHFVDCAIPNPYFYYVNRDRARESVQSLLQAYKEKAELCDVVVDKLGILFQGDGFSIRSKGFLEYLTVLDECIVFRLFSSNANVSFFQPPVYCESQMVLTSDLIGEIFSVIPQEYLRVTSNGECFLVADFLYGQNEKELRSIRRDLLTKQNFLIGAWKKRVDKERQREKSLSQLQRELTIKMDDLRNKQYAQPSEMCFNAVDDFMRRHDERFTQESLPGSNHVEMTRLHALILGYQRAFSALQNKKNEYQDTWRRINDLINARDKFFKTLDSAVKGMSEIEIFQKKLAEISSIHQALLALLARLDEIPAEIKNQLDEAKKRLQEATDLLDQSYRQAPSVEQGTDLAPPPPQRAAGAAVRRPARAPAPGPGAQAARATGDLPVVTLVKDGRDRNSSTAAMQGWFRQRPAEFSDTLYVALMRGVSGLTERHVQFDSLSEEDKRCHHVEMLEFLLCAIELYKGCFAVAREEAIMSFDVCLAHNMHIFTYIESLFVGEWPARLLGALVASKDKRHFCQIVGQFVTEIHTIPVIPALLDRELKSIDFKKNLNTLIGQLRYAQEQFTRERNPCYLWASRMLLRLMVENLYQALIFMVRERNLNADNNLDTVDKQKAAIWGLLDHRALLKERLGLSDQQIECFKQLQNYRNTLRHDHHSNIVMSVFADAVDVHVHIKALLEMVNISLAAFSPAAPAADLKPEPTLSTSAGVAGMSLFAVSPDLRESSRIARKHEPDQGTSENEHNSLQVDSPSLSHLN